MDPVPVSMLVRLLLKGDQLLAPPSSSARSRVQTVLILDTLLRSRPPSANSVPAPPMVLVPDQLVRPETVRSSAPCRVRH